MISAHCLLSLCALITFYLTKTSSVSFLACNSSGPSLIPNWVASYRVSDPPQFVECNVWPDAYFSHCTTMQVLSHGSIQSECPADTAVTRYSDILVHLVSDTSMDVAPAQDLGVPLFCALESDTNTSITQELGVQNNVMHKNSSVQDFSVFSFRLPASIPFLFEGRSTVTAAYQNSQVVNTIGCGAEDHSLGVYIVTFVLDFVRLFGFVAQVPARCTHFMVFRVLIHLTPHNNCWPQYICRLNLFTIGCCFTSLKTVFEKCRRLRAIIFRNLFRRNNFAVFWTKSCIV